MRITQGHAEFKECQLSFRDFKLTTETKTQPSNPVLVLPPHFLVGGFNPTEKYARQIGRLPQFSGENNKYFENTT